MRPISTVPPLPYPGSRTIAGLAAYDQDLSRSLNNYLSEMARRANAGLPMDGTGTMTGNLVMGGFDITGVGNITISGTATANSLSTTTATIGTLTLTNPLSISYGGTASTTAPAAAVALRAVGYDAQSFTDTERSVARANIGATIRGALYGLALANNATDATNDIDIATGSAASDNTPQTLMSLASAITKQLDVNWAAGTNQGMRYSGAAIANTTYHIWLVAKAASADVDIYADPSADAATVLGHLQAEAGGSAYLYVRRIGSIIRSSGAILGFRQIEDRFMLTGGAVNRSSTSAATNALVTMTTPLGIKTRPIIVSFCQNGTGSTLVNALGDGDGSTTAVNYQQLALTSEVDRVLIDQFYTDTSSQVRFSATITGTITSNVLATLGWYDMRGRI